MLVFRTNSYCRGKYLAVVKKPWSDVFLQFTKRQGFRNIGCRDRGPVAEWLRLLISLLLLIV